MSSPNLRRSHDHHRRSVSTLKRRPCYIGFVVVLAWPLLGCSGDVTTSSEFQYDTRPLAPSDAMDDVPAPDAVAPTPSDVAVDDTSVPGSFDAAGDDIHTTVPEVDTDSDDVVAESDAAIPEDAGALDAAVVDVPPDAAIPLDPGDTAPPACFVPRPILLVHGINGSSADYTVMVQRLLDAGWPADLVFTFDAVDPGWTCNVDNATAIDVLVSKILAETGHTRIDLVAHSMGTLSTRYWLKSLGGHEKVNTYVTLGGMNHGLSSPCWAPAFLGVCVWAELCETGAFVAALNADPATPGQTHWVSLIGSADTTVPNASSTLLGAENITFDGVEHSGAKGLLEVPEVFDEVLRVLAYPCW